VVETAAAEKAAAEKAAPSPDWARADSDVSHYEEEDKDLDVAVGAIAKAAVVTVKTFLIGDFTALLGMADTLENKVLRMGWSSDEFSERKASVEYDERTGMYAVLVIEGQKSSKYVKRGIFGKTTYTAKLKMTLKRAQAKNDDARAICQKLMNNAAGDLVGQLEQLKIF